MAESRSASPVLRLGVRELAEFACREGDLERGPAGPTAEQGKLAHQRLQKSWPELTAELPLSRCTEIDGLSVSVSGRMDLVDESASRLIEIKSTLVPVQRLGEGRRALDRAQLGLYAWLWLERDSARTPELELRYVNLRDDSVESVHVVMTQEQIHTNALLALRCRVEFEHSLRARQRSLRDSAEQLAFPHGGLRPSQRTLAAATYRTVRDGSLLLIEAPTGSGKSLGTLFPAVKALGEGKVTRLAWLTAKKSGRESACQAMNVLQQQGLDATTLVLRSRRAACPCEQQRHDSAGTLEQDLMPCDWTLGYHERLRRARQHVIESVNGVLDGDRIDQLAREFRLCPQAFAADLVPWLPLVICDYNHVFDPVASVSQLRDDHQQRALLIDEAHNLPSRSRSMYSQTLGRAQCKEAVRMTRTEWPALSRAFDSLVRALTAVAPARGTEADTIVLEELPAKCVRALKRVTEVLANPPENTDTTPSFSAVSARVSEVAMAIHRLLLLESQWLPSHRCLIHGAGSRQDRDVAIRVECLDAGAPVAQLLASMHAAVLMSASLTPLTHFRDMFGLPADTPCLSVESPFEASQWQCQLVDWIPVRYAERAASTPALVDLIERVASAKAGHYLVFLPSFAYLDSVYQAFSTAVEHIDAWCQPRGAQPADISRLLARLDDDGHSVGFVIAGGSLGEGVDYRGDRLIGAIVVGVGLPPPSLEADLAIAHHRSQGRDGFDTECRYPGFVRVLQSAGRVVRTEQDHGVVVLVDARFNEGFYTRLLPKVWKPTTPPDAQAVSQELDTFWSGSDTRDENKNARRVARTGRALPDLT